MDKNVTKEKMWGRVAAGFSVALSADVHDKPHSGSGQDAGLNYLPNSYSSGAYDRPMRKKISSRRRRNKIARANRKANFNKQ